MKYVGICSYFFKFFQEISQMLKPPYVYSNELWVNIYTYSLIDQIYNWMLK